MLMHPLISFTAFISILDISFSVRLLFSMEKFLIIVLGIVIFAVTKWYRVSDKPLDPDLFDNPEKKQRRKEWWEAGEGGTD